MKKPFRMVWNGYENYLIIRLGGGVFLLLENLWCLLTGKMSGRMRKGDMVASASER